MSPLKGELCGRQASPDSACLDKALRHPEIIWEVEVTVHVICYTDGSEGQSGIIAGFLFYLNEK